MAIDGSLLRLLSHPDGSEPEVMTKSLSGESTSKARRHLADKGVTILGENSRGHVMGRGPDTFHKSLTPDSARRVESFYTSLERASSGSGSVPRLIGLEHLDEQVSVACFEYVDGRPGTTHDTWECLDLYARLQTAATQHGDRAGQALIDACLNETSTWSDELLGAWDPVNWTDPKILHWGGTDAAGMTGVGVPALRTVADALSGLALDGTCSPVHADLSTGNYLRAHDGRPVVFDWDEGYWGLPGMGLQILLREAMDDGLEGLGFTDLLRHVPRLADSGLTAHGLAVRTLAGAVIEIAGVRQSLREMGRPPGRHGAYLAAWACRYEWIISRAR